MTRTSTTLRFAMLLTLANGFLDAHTYLARGGVFANVQTANVILFAIETSRHKYFAALAHVWPLLAFIAGVLLAAYIKDGGLDRVTGYPLRWTMAVQAVVLGVIGFVPASVSHSYVTVPIAFVAAVQIGLFRSIGALVYLPVATTGNLMRVVEAGYDTFVAKRDAARRAFTVYATITVTFSAGAVIGAFATEALGVRAIWIPAALLIVTLGMFIHDERMGEDPEPEP